MDTFATIGSVVGGAVAFLGAVAAYQFADATESWSIMSFAMLAGAVGFGLLIILVAQVLHVLVAIEENTREILEVVEADEDSDLS